jgi:hypothetical protein
LERDESTVPTEARRQTVRRRRQLRLVCVGLACMVSGEAFCIFGPLSYPHFVHVVCHAVFYAGVVLCAGAAVLHWGVKPSTVR